MTRRLSILAALIATHTKASACAVCMGDPNPNSATATNATLWVLLGLVAFIFAATGFTAFYIWRRGRNSKK